MILEIEAQRSMPLGSFSALPAEDQRRLIAWYRVRVDPTGKRGQGEPPPPPPRRR